MPIICSIYFVNILSINKIYFFAFSVHSTNNCTIIGIILFYVIIKVTNTYILTHHPHPVLPPYPHPLHTPPTPPTHRSMLTVLSSLKKGHVCYDLTECWLNKCYRHGDLSRLLGPVLVILLHSDTARSVGGRGQLGVTS